MTQADSVHSTPPVKFSEAFSELEGHICDLTRMAKLATQQVYRAVGELKFDGKKYLEVPNADDTELAIFAVGQVLEMTKKFDALYFRLHNEACSAR